MPLIVLSNNLTPSYLLYLSYFVPTGTAFVTFCESNAKALSTGYALSKVPLRPAGGIATLTLANSFAFSSTHFVHAKAHLNQVRNNAKSIYFATLQYLSPQNLYSLHCCVLPFYSGFTLSNSQYQELFIFFARMPSSLFAFSNVLFEIPCSSAISKISLL